MIIFLNLWDMSSIMDTVTKIGTPLSLIAFVIAIIGFVLRTKILNERKALAERTGERKFEEAELILDRLHVSTMGLTKDQKYNLAMQKLKNRAQHRMTITVLIAFLAVVALLMVLFYNEADKTEVSEDEISSSDTKSLNYSIVLTVRKDSIVQRLISDSKEFTNDHCARNQNIDWRINADNLNNWYIDISTIKVSPTKRKNDTYSGVFNQSRVGFNIKGVVRNHGDCVEVLGKIVSYDARGKLAVSYSYIENKTMTSILPSKDTLKGILNLGVSKAVAFPDNTENYKITIKESDGTIVELDKANQNQGTYWLIPSVTGVTINSRL